MDQDKKNINLSKNIIKTNEKTHTEQIKNINTNKLKDNILFKKYPSPTVAYIDDSNIYDNHKKVFLEYDVKQLK